MLSTRLSEIFNNKRQPVIYVEETSRLVTCQDRNQSSRSVVVDSQSCFMKQSIQPTKQILL